MANIVFNIAKGRVGYYGDLVEAAAANEALIVIPIETSGIVGDSTMIDYDTVAAILAGASNEQSTMGRKTITGVTVTTDDSGNQVTVALDSDITWTSASGNAISALVVAFDADTGTGDDSDLVPLTKHDFTATPDGNDITVTAATIFTAS